MPGHHRHQSPHVGSLDSNHRDKLLPVFGARQIDLRLPRADNMNMRWFMVRRGDHKPRAVGAVNNNHLNI